MVKPVGRVEQIPVSAKMIGAGLRAIETWRDLPPGELIAAVYRAMAAAALADQTHMSERSPTISEILKRFDRR